MELIYVKEVDKSLLYQGFTIRTALLNSFLGIFGKLDIGEMRQISILLNGKIYSGIKVVNQNFDRNKYPNHPEMYQVRYDNMNDFLQALRSEFSDLYNFIDEQMKIKKIMKERGENMSNIKRQHLFFLSNCCLPLSVGLLLSLPAVVCVRICFSAGLRLSQLGK